MLLKDHPNKSNNPEGWIKLWTYPQIIKMNIWPKKNLLQQGVGGIKSCDNVTWLGI